MEKVKNGSRSKIYLNREQTLRFKEALMPGVVRVLSERKRKARESKQGSPS